MGWRRSVGVSREGGGGGTAGEERVGVSTYIQSNNKKKEPFVGMGSRAHPHPRCCCALAFSSPPTLAFVSSRPWVVLSCQHWRERLGGPEHEKRAITGTFFVFGWKRTSRKRKTRPEGRVLRFRLVGNGWAAVRHEKRAGGARFSCLSGGMSHGG